MTGTLVATFSAAARLHYLAAHEPFEDESILVQGDMLPGALAGCVRKDLFDPELTLSVLVMTVAAEIAAARPDVKGPGTFRAALLDELYNLTPEVLVQRANAEIIA